jgi:hypothetical protein
MAGALCSCGRLPSGLRLLQLAVVARNGQGLRLPCWLLQGAASGGPLCAAPAGSLFLLLLLLLLLWAPHAAVAAAEP